MLSVRWEAACGTHPLGLSAGSQARSLESGTLSLRGHLSSFKPRIRILGGSGMFRLEQQPSSSQPGPARASQGQPGPPHPAAWVAQPSPLSNEQKRGRPVLTTQQDCGQNTWHSSRAVMIGGVTSPPWGPWQCLETFWSQAGWACCWCLVDRGRGHCSPLPRQPCPLPQEALSSPSVSQAEVERLGAGLAHR